MAFPWAYREGGVAMKTLGMRTLTIGSLAVGALIATPAMAADMATPAPRTVATPYVPAPAPTWTGCYVGLNGGYGWNNGHSSYTNDPNAPNADIVNGLPGPIALAFVPVPAATGGSGALAGGEAGCNVQSGQWVAGLETDIDWTHIAGSGSSVVNSGQARFALEPNGFSNTFDTATANEQVSLRGLSTFRARGGFALQNSVLLFTTAGLAIGDVATQGSITELNVNGNWTGSSTVVKTGGVIGGGAEWAFYNHWTAKVEYLWYDLGRVSHPLNFPRGVVGAAASGFFATVGDTASLVSGSIVRLGLNYKF